MTERSILATKLQYENMRPLLAESCTSLHQRIYEIAPSPSAVGGGALTATRPHKPPFPLSTHHDHQLLLISKHRRDRFWWKHRENPHRDHQRRGNGSHRSCLRLRRRHACFSSPQEFQINPFHHCLVQARSIRLHVYWPFRYRGCGSGLRVEQPSPSEE